MHKTKIQWPDGTVSPVPSCDGCPLRWPEGAVEREIEKHLRSAGFDRSDVEKAVPAYRACEEFSRRKRILAAVSAAVPTEVQGSNTLVLSMTQQIYTITSRCYAGAQTDNRGGKVKGYADRFEKITLFPGRMEIAARRKSIQGRARPDKPWLDGCRYLWFVNDMGDALSREVPFEFLEKEIVQIAASENGQRHFWLWLTKRPKRMAEFCRWLQKRGIAWPKNLIPMTSVIDRKMARQVKYLTEIPVNPRGLSVEPLLEPVQLDLNGIGWVIVGGESGALSRPFDLAWARDIREQCRRAGVPFFVKQLGSNPVENGTPLTLTDRHGGDWSEFPEDLRVREVPNAFRQPQ
jgi:protein gp37